MKVQAERECLPGHMPMGAGFFEKMWANWEIWGRGLIMDEGKLFELSLLAQLLM